MPAYRCYFCWAALMQLYWDAGWKRMALQILYFVPGNLLDPEASFQALQRKLLVSPVLQTLVYSKNPEGSQDWIERITSWKFKRVIPAHFAAPVAAGPKDLRSECSSCACAVRAL